MDQQHEHVFLLDGPLRPALMAAERRRHAFDAELARAHERAVQLDPLRGNPALVPAHAELRVGAVVMNEPREKSGHVRFPPAERRRRQRSFEHVLVGGDEALRQVEARLPDAIRHFRGGLEALDVLPEQLAPVGAERGIRVLQRLRARKVHRSTRLAQAFERAHDVFLARDDIEGGQVAQPHARRLGGDDRVARVANARVQKAEHDFRKPNMTGGLESPTRRASRRRSSFPSTGFRR